MTTLIRLDDESERRLAHLVERTGRIKAHYLRELIARGLDEVEEAFLAAATLERVRAGRERVFSAEQVRTELGLDA